MAGRIAFVAFVCVTTAHLSAARGQTVRYVDASAAGGGDGLSWETAYKKLQPALQEAEGGGIDQIWVADGMYHPAPADGSRTATFQLISGVAIYGGFAGGETELDERDPAVNICILSGDLNDNDGPDFANNDENSYHVVTGSGVADTSILDGFAIQGGNANGDAPDDYGAGILIVAGSPMIANCTITSNHTRDGVDPPEPGGHGAGLFCDDGSDVLLTNCTISGNETGHGAFDETGFAPNSGPGGDGGGGYVSDSTLALVDCTIAGNISGGGGSAVVGANGGRGAGVYAANSTIFLTGATVSSNTCGKGGDGCCESTGFEVGGAGGSGGGIYCSGGSLVLEDCTFSMNLAGHGGSTGFYGSGGSGGGGGAVWCSGTAATLEGCVVEANLAGSGGFGQGGGPGGRGAGAYLAGLSATISNCEFLNNTAGGGGDGWGLEATFGSGGYGGSGGGIFSYSSAILTIEDSLIEGNHAGDGGSVLDDNGDPAGDGGSGGGIVCADGMVVRCTIVDNSAGSGGGAYGYGGDGGDGGGLSATSTVVVECDVFENFAGAGGPAADCAGRGGNGGGIECTGLTIVNCRVFSNHAGSSGSVDSCGDGGDGGGIACHTGTFVNCTVVANEAGDGTGSFGGSGGGIYGSGLNAVNCTVWGNDAGGGNLFNGSGGGVYGSGSVSNSILWANTIDGVGYEAAQVAGAPAVNYNCVQFWSGILEGMGNIGDDPIVVDPDGPDNLLGTDDDDLHLTGTSPCIDAADNDAVPADSTDLDNDGDTSEQTPLDLGVLPRFVDDPFVEDTGNGAPPIVDMGAFEFADCNDNGVADPMDIVGGTSQDCNTNTAPDECEPGWTDDCNTNGVIDLCEPGGLIDCNSNGALDECDIGMGKALDCDGDGVPDECGLVDCNTNGALDECDIVGGGSFDCNTNAVPDECDPSQADCNTNGVPDACDIADGASPDCNTDTVPDECDPGLTDCNTNEVGDICELLDESESDDDGDVVLDVCDDCPGLFNPEQEEWLLRTVESGNVGTYSSLRIDPADRIVVSYFDSGNGDLRLWRDDDGDLESDTGEIRTIASDDVVGQYTSLRFDDAGRIVLAFYKVTGGDLMLFFDADGDLVADVAEVQAIDTPNDRGRYASLARATGGQATVAYYDQTLTDLRLWHDADGDFAADAGETNVIDSVGVVGQYASLAFDASGQAAIAYYDATGHDLEFWHDANGNFLDDTGERVTIEAPGDKGKFCSLAYDAAGVATVVYLDEGMDDLRLWHDANGNSAFDAGEIVVIDSTGNTGRYISLNFDSQGRALASYDRADTDNLRLWFDADGDFQVDNGETQSVQMADEFGSYSSIAFHPGFYAPLIAYRDADEGLKLTAPLDWDGDGACFGVDDCPQRKPGDVNGDALVNAEDVGAFVGVLLDPESASPESACAADVNGSGQADGDDVQGFVELLLGD